MIPQLDAVIQDVYTASSIAPVLQRLDEHRVFQFDRFDSGLFPAVGHGATHEATSGYRAVWIRDNVHIAYAHHVAGDHSSALQATLAMADFLLTQQGRIQNIIQGCADPDIPMMRPHIRFSGDTGLNIAEKWPHAQNDAIGYFIWLYGTLAHDGVLAPQQNHIDLLADLVRYLHTITYWKDEDSGHWEEQRKISASSIGTVNAGLTAYRKWLMRANASAQTILNIDTLLEKGTQRLHRILPAECIQTNPIKKRRNDAALLFLIDPLDVVDDDMAVRIVDNVTTHLLGEWGIARYQGDSYWGPDYRNIPPEKRTVDLSDDIISRDAFSKRGQEARWTIFDSILSIYFGRRFRATGHMDDFKKQCLHFNRSLSQLTYHPKSKERWALPEAYFVENGMWVPNDHIPLQWGHANLQRACLSMQESTRLVPFRDLD